MKTGFIGTGNMAQALIKGFASIMEHPEKEIFITDIDMNKAEKTATGFNVSLCSSIIEVCKASDAVVLAVKPGVYGTVLKELALIPGIDKKLIISIAPGLSLEFLKSHFIQVPPVVRIMPNTPALAGKGMFAVTPDPSVPVSALNELIRLLKSVGIVDQIPEYLMDAVTGLSGSGPAYVYVFIEALADGAVLKGMPRDKAYIYAAQTVLGAAQMVLDTGMHPGQLKDQVTSPGGTTIEALRVLEARGFRSSVIEAVSAAADKSSRMGK